MNPIEPQAMKKRTKRLGRRKVAAVLLVSEICALLVAGLVYSLFYHRNEIPFLFAPRGPDIARVFPGHRYDRWIGFSPSGDFFATIPTVTIWDVSAGTRLGRILTPRGISKIAFAPDGRRLVANSGESVCQVWDLVTQQQIATTLNKYGIIYSLAFGPDGKTVAVSTEEEGQKFLALWDSATGQEKVRVRYDDYHSLKLAYSPTEPILVAAGDRDRLTVREAASAKEIRKFAWSSKGFFGTLSVTFSANGKLLAIGSGHGEVGLWETTNWRCLFRIKAHEAHTICVSFSPDGKTVASASKGDVVKFWDTQSGRLVTTIPGNYFVAFSPDGKYVAVLQDKKGDLTGMGDWIVLYHRDKVLP